VTGLYPQLVNYLPNRVSYLSETAPPPRNPKLQYCVDSFVFEQLDNGVGDVPGKLAAARSIDLSALPAGLQKDLSKSFDQAQIALDAVPSIHAAERAVEEAAVDYRPILRDVRAIQKQVNRLAKKADDLGREAGRLRATDDKTVEQRARMEARKAELEAEIAQLQSRIPADWDEVHKVFEKLTKAETNARNTHRRAADTAYDDAAEVLAVLNGTPALLALEGEITALRSAVESGDAVETAAKLDALADQVREIEGAGDVRKGLNNARRVLEKTPDDRAKALADFDSAVAELAAQKTWRQAADSSVKPQLQAYVDGILPTLGARSLSQLSEDQALYIASCNAGHRDLSLNF
jgi:chromosome segregation ATPase